MVVEGIEIRLGVRLLDLGINGHLQNFDVLFMDLFVDVLVLFIVCELLTVLNEKGFLSFTELRVKNQIAELIVDFFVFI
jgi:hypothetical protein